MKVKRLAAVIALITLLCIGYSVRNEFKAGRSNPEFKVDRSNPESVLRAYFDAWERGDWSTKKSLMHPHYRETMNEPVKSIRLIEVHEEKRLSKTRVIYHVIFDIKVVGRGLSMQNGRYDWTYYLAWDDRSNSWIITDYGSC